MINIKNETYQTTHHPNDILMVSANQLHKDNLEVFLEEISSSNHDGNWKKLGSNFFEYELNEQIKRTTDEDALAYKNIFESSMPCLVHVRQNIPSLQKKDIKGLALRFSTLKKESDILSFARTYGMLGVLDRGWIKYSSTNFETLNTWQTYITHINRLIKLYKTLKEKKQGKGKEVIGEFFNLEEETFYKIGEGEIKRAKISWTEKYLIKEMEDKQLDGVNNIPNPAPVVPREVEERREYDGLIGSYILALLIKKGLEGAGKISFSEVFLSDSSPIGFSFNETYSCQYLLGAIYQDLWRLITSDISIRYCNYCDRPFEKKGKKRHCNDSCRQMAYKERKSKDSQQLL